MLRFVLDLLYFLRFHFVNFLFVNSRGGRESYRFGGGGNFARGGGGQYPITCHV